jgi:hypothetical protein
MRYVANDFTDLMSNRLVWKVQIHEMLVPLAKEYGMNRSLWVAAIGLLACSVEVHAADCPGITAGLLTDPGVPSIEIYPPDGIIWVAVTSTEDRASIGILFQSAPYSGPGPILRSKGTSLKAGETLQISVPTQGTYRETDSREYVGKMYVDGCVADIPGKVMFNFSRLFPSP